MSLTADLRQTWRNARRAPGLTLAVVLTLAVGIGANGAVWSVLRAVLLEPLPYPQPERLVKVISKFPTLGFERFWVSPPEFLEYREWNRSFTDLGAYRAIDVSVAGTDQPVRVRGSGREREPVLRARRRSAARPRLHRSRGRRRRSAGRGHLASTLGRVVRSVAGGRRRTDHDRRRRAHAARRDAAALRSRGGRHPGVAAARALAQRSHPPRQSLHLPDRPSEARSDAGLGARRARRADRRLGHSRPGHPRAGEAEPSAASRAPARRGGGRDPSGAPGPGRRRRVPPPHRLHQRRQPPALALGRARAGDGDPRGDGSAAAPHGAPAPHRERGVGAGGRRPRRGGGPRRSARAAALEPRQPAAHRRRASRHHRAARLARGLGGRRHPVRPRAGAQALGRPLRHPAQGGRSPPIDRRRRRARPARSHRRRDGAGGGAGGGLRAHDPHGADAARRRHRLRGGAPHHLRALLTADQLPRSERSDDVLRASGRVARVHARRRAGRQRERAAATARGERQRHAVRGPRGRSPGTAAQHRLLAVRDR